MNESVRAKQNNKFKNPQTQTGAPKTTIVPGIKKKGKGFRSGPNTLPSRYSAGTVKALGAP